MSLFNFDDSDATADSVMIGGIAGFIEESIREETTGETDQELPTEEEIEVERSIQEITDQQLIDFAGRNPDLFRFIVGLVKKHYGSPKKIEPISEESRIEQENIAMSQLLIPKSI